MEPYNCCQILQEISGFVFATSVDQDFVKKRKLVLRQNKFLYVSICFYMFLKHNLIFFPSNCEYPLWKVEKKKKSPALLAQHDFFFLIFANKNLEK